MRFLRCARGDESSLTPFWLADLFHNAIVVLPPRWFSEVRGGTTLYIDGEGTLLPEWSGLHDKGRLQTRRNQGRNARLVFNVGIAVSQTAPVV